MSGDPVLEMLDWLDSFKDVAPLEMDRARRILLSTAVREWAGRQIAGELPPPIAEAERRDTDSCAWCFEPLGEMLAELHGGVGHPECTRYAYECLSGDGAMPWPIPEPTVYRHDLLDAFLERLGHAASRHGIDPHKLARALEDASTDG